MLAPIGVRLGGVPFEANIHDKIVTTNM
jgi:hypothetical protein